MANRLPCALLLAYDGSAFRGWQRQPGMPTIQEAIERALGESLDRKVQIFGAARTDAGVHAQGQVCHFVKEAVATEAAVEQLSASLRSLLPSSVTVRAASLAHPSFHARSSAIGKSYRYRFSWGAPISMESRDAFQLGPTAMPDWSRARAALEEMSKLDALPGLSSPSTDRRPAPPLAQWNIAIDSADATRCALSVAGPAFRKHQVRNLAGHLAAIALGLAEPDSLARLAARARPWMGACAPPHGLTLMRVDYPRELDPFGLLSSACSDAGEKIR